MEIKMDLIEYIEYTISYEKWLETVQEEFFEDEALSQMEQDFRF